MELKLTFPIEHQPDDFTCGPTCLHAVYAYYGDQIELPDLIKQVTVLEEGGTLAVFLGQHALNRGYGATICTYNMSMFDPTWFVDPGVDLPAKLRAQAAAKHDEKLRAATEGYLAFLSNGGVLVSEDLTPELIYRHLDAHRPILTGLSATYLHRSMREFGPKSDEDDIRGEPVGHFVVFCGYNRAAGTLLVADPMRANPFSPTRVYTVNLERAIHSILLGVLTYDANLLILTPPDDAKER